MKGGRVRKRFRLSILHQPGIEVAINTVCVLIHCSFRKAYVIKMLNVITMLITTLTLTKLVTPLDELRFTNVPYKINTC